MSNRVRTTKYTCLSFFPKNLFEQFCKMANAYFLFMAVVQLMPGLMDLYGSATTIMPLMFIVAISMIKDGFEDNKRRKQDNDENRSPTLVCPRGQQAFIQIKSEEVQVGCLVKIRDNEFFPADLMLLSTSLPKGICYVETKNLDGETNLKHKQAVGQVLRLAQDERQVLTNFNGAQINCEGPNEFLYKFQGSITLPDGAEIQIEPDQILLRGSALRNTEWVYGIAVYTGHESKIMKNSSNAVVKTSKIQKLTNIYILVTMLIQFVISLGAGCGTEIWTYLCGADYWYLYPLGGNDEGSLAAQMIISTMNWFVTLMNFVPISLLVTLEMISFIQAFFMSVDVMMVDECTGIEASVQSSNLNEELGMVHYIFSDKTGTLTQNIMEFKKFSAGMINYGKSDPSKEIEYAPGVTNVNFDDPSV